jgi:hypothetical protein
MSTTKAPSHALAEAVASYGRSGAGEAATKLSISLPTPLVEEIRATAAASGQSVSGVIAAAVRSAIDREMEVRLEAAIESQNQENLELAEAYLPVAARIWSELEW